MNSNWSYSLEKAKLGFHLCDLDLWPLNLTFCMDITSIIGNHSWKFHDDMMNKVNLRELIAATGLVISNWIKNVDFSACVTLKFYGWPPKTIGHFFHTTSSFVHHFKFIGEFKLELQPGSAKFWSKLVIFCPVWPWNLMDDLRKQ